jgi:cytochrome c5
MSKYHNYDRNPLRGTGFIAIMFTISLFVSGCDKGESNQSPAPATESMAAAKDMAIQTPEPMAEVTSSVAAVEQTMDEPVQVAAADAGSEAGGSIDGEKVYKGLCFNCHGTGVPNIPQTGNKEAWAPRIAQGKDVLYNNAIKGFTGKSGMPMLPKGGNSALTDDEVKAAVDHMVSNSQ